MPCLLLAVVATTSVAADCIELKRVQVADNPVLDSEQVEQLLAPFLGECIDAQLMRELLDRVSAGIIDAGYVTTRPYYLEQDVRDGEVEIEVLPGRVEAVIDADTGEGNARIASAFLFNGSLLNLRELETALEAIERPQSVQADFEIRPGQEPGGSVVAVNTEQTSRFSGELGANARTDLDPQLSFRLAFDNPLNINDIIEFRYNSGDVFQAIQSDRSRELEYSVQVGATLFSYLYSELSYRERLQGVNGSFLAEGDSETDRLSISHLLARDRAYRLRLGFALELDDSVNEFEGEIIDVSSYKTSKATLSLDHDWYADWGQLYSYYAYQRGLDDFGARDDDYFTSIAGFENEARLQFEKHVLALRSYVDLADPSWFVGLGLHVQYSDDNLFDRDRLTLGSETTVRGYTSALAGSRGWYSRLELGKRWYSSEDPDRPVLSGKSINLAIGFDAGEIVCQSDNRDVCGEIYSIASGLTVRDDNFSALLSYGHPLREVESGGDEDVFLLDLRWAL